MRHRISATRSNWCRPTCSPAIARLRGRPVRFLTGTDDNALKNVTAARAAGVPVRDFVARNADRFAGLREPLGLSFDDFIRTSADPRHRPGVERLWQQCAAAGDFYRRGYEGLYCAGCEQFYAPGRADRRALPRARRARRSLVAEQNWFFRLSRYAEEVRGDPGVRPGADRAGGPAQRGAGVRPRRARRLQRLPAGRARRRLGHPGAGRPRPGRLRVVGRADQLRHRPRVRLRGCRIPPVVDRIRRSGARHRQGHRPLPRRVLARAPALRRPAAARPPSSCTTT